MSATKRLNSPMKCLNEATAKKQKLFSPQKNALLDGCFEDDDCFDYLDLQSLEHQHSQANTALPPLDLSQWQRCVIKNLEREQRTFDLVLQLTLDGEKDKENLSDVGVPEAICHLKGPWSHMRLAMGDIISLQAVWDEHLKHYKVDKDQGMCVANPDTLISGTTVMGSLFCKRKAVLQDRFRGVDANSKIMVVGTMVHELLQIVLARGLKTLSEIELVYKQLLESKSTAYTLYETLMSREEMALEMQKFVPNIFNFMQQYVEGKELQMLHKDNFLGQITEIEDIEENLWVPQLGLKGKIDVSVKIQRRRNLGSSKYAIPLELKTGRASFSMEHKGQVILYQMMRTAVGKYTQSGLLLYLREGIMREISATRNEQRDLVMLRNDLSHYLTKFPPLPMHPESFKLSEDKFVQPFELPEPISHHSACENCAYNTICCTFVRTDPDTNLREGHPLQKVMAETTAHLEPAHYEYFIHWCALLTLEEQEVRKAWNMRSLWLDSAENRQRSGRAITNLELSPGVEAEDMRFLHIFNTKDKTEERDLTLSGFSVGEYVIVSTTKRLAIAAGCVNELTKSTISVSVERNMHKNYSDETFVIDKHESQSGNVFNYTNLGLLLDNTERAARLREIVIERRPPAFGKVLQKWIATQGASIFEKLNAVQRKAVLKALTTQSFLLIKGLPGTGKTQTLVAIVRLLYMMGKSVLITSHTHSAVDNLLLRLKTLSLPFLRLGSSARTNPQLMAYNESELLKDCLTEQDLAQKYNSFQIVGSTCLGTGHSIFLRRRFDYCIVDEAAQVLQPTVLRPLYFCDKFILVGDPDQLPPLIRSKEARLRGADESLFMRLDTEAATAVLTLQYRMNKTITKLANALTYGGALQCSSDKLQDATIKVQIPPEFAQKKWLQRALQTHIDQAVFLLDTKDCAERSFAFASAKHSDTCAAIEQTFAENPQPSPSKQSATKRRLSKYTNYCDAAVVFELVKCLLLAGYNPADIGIIAPYRAQVELLKKLANQYHAFYQQQSLAAVNFSLVEVNTVDQYQGRDKHIILYSCAKTGSPASAATERCREAEILEDKRRLTVAITRAKYKLILVGDAVCLQQYTPFRTLLSRIPGYCKLQLVDDKLGFKWQHLLDELANVLSTQQ